MEYTTKQEAFQALLNGSEKVRFVRTDSFMNGQQTPFRVWYYNAKGNRVNTLSTFAIWDWEVINYLEEVPSGYDINPADYKYNYAMDYMSMEMAVAVGDQPKCMGEWKRSLIKPGFVDKSFDGNFYLEKDQGDYEVIFCNQPIVEIRVESNPNFKGFDVIDYTPKNNVVEETWYDAAPAKQETEIEDRYAKKRTDYDNLRFNLVGSHGKCQSKSKAKWQRSGRAARVLSNR